jgi:methylmalonyl-CoA mutase
MYANPKEEKPELRIQNFGKIYAEQYKEFMSGREKIVQSKLSNSLSNLKKSGDAIFDTAIECALNGASRKDISDNIFNTVEELQIKTLKPVRASEIFEILRDVTDDIKDKTGKTPSVFLATMGTVKQHKARADFSRGFLEVAGLDVIYNKGYESAQEAVSDAVKSGSKAIVICSTDETYPELVPKITAEVKKQSPEMLVILAGYPKEQIDALKSSGVEEFIYMGADVYDTLNRILKRLI